MVNINLAYTQAINPAGATPVLTRAQVWAGLERKVRHAHEFVPVFEGCEVIEEHENVVVRETKLKPMEGRPGKTQRETCKLFKPAKVSRFYFYTGARVVRPYTLHGTGAENGGRSISIKRTEASSPTWCRMVQD
jgi:hypothetical protein